MAQKKEEIIIDKKYGGKVVCEDLAVQDWHLDNEGRILDEVYFEKETKEAFVFTFVSSED